MEIQEQLRMLREKVARIERKFATAPPRSAPPPPYDDLRPARYFVEDLIHGEVVETAAGAHFETEKLYARHRLHGSMEISTLIELPEDLLAALSGGAIQRAHPKRWAFLDTETTGLAGGAGTYAFLVGVGSIDEEGFRVRQFFMRDFADEASLLARLTEHLAQFDVLVTYNGKAYDQPLLETRFRMARARSPFTRMEHLDLLYGARRLWKLRVESCRLTDLENRILGVERDGDVPGEMIPYYYFEYLRTRQAFRLVPVFHHNVVDIVSLACLTAIVPFAFREPHAAEVRHGADLVGIARWLAHAGRHAEAADLLRRAVDVGLPDALLFRALWDAAAWDKKLGNTASALATWTDLSASPNPYRAAAFEELAKYYEHQQKNDAMALEMTLGALACEESEVHRRREQRLRKRLSSPRVRRLAL
ncbi:MAG: ribonuclease H-like domain-containing protein [Bryobacterales bacterium]|nr:ribonuclease H-like domain-containing protein [Bryobacterales bacterium]